MPLMHPWMMSALTYAFTRKGLILQHTECGARTVTRTQSHKREKYCEDTRGTGAGCMRNVTG